MIERQQVNIRLERELVDALDDLARTEHIDRTELARRILAEGVQRSKVDRSLKDYAAGKVTAWRAARDAGVSLYEMLDRIHEARIPYELNEDDLTRLRDVVSSRRAPGQTRAAEPGAAYGTTTAPADRESGIEELRQMYRPDVVNVLFVGESSPAQGTHFYRANSNLYRTTRAAFAEALGEDVVPAGEAFLRFFRDRGCWLVDLADEPVNRLADGERRSAAERGVERLAALIRDVRPKQVVAVKRDIGDLVRRALDMAAATDTPLLVLPFPVRQWAKDYQAGLVAALRGDAFLGSRPDVSERIQPTSAPDAEEVLRNLVGRPLRTISQGKVNTILDVTSSRFLVATDDSPDGAWERIKIIQDALDRLYRKKQLEVTKGSLGHRRTALVGAILVQLPGVEVASTRPRVLVLSEPG